MTLSLLMAALLTQEAKPETPEVIKDLTIGIRITDLGGTFDGDEDWGDFWSTGVGIELKYEHLWKVSKRVHLGLYGGFSYDRFSGVSETFTDGVDVLTVEHEDLDLLRFVVGGRVRESFNKFFMDQSVGVGFAWYRDVDADATLNGFPFTVGSIAGGQEITFELAARFGFQLSPTAAIWISLGYENNGAPDVHDDIDDGTFDYENQKNFVFSFGASFDF